jgi:DNA repair protein RadC
MDQPPSESSVPAPVRKPVKYVIEQSSGRVCDMPARLRPREEMARLGAENVSDAVLLAVILRTGLKGTNVADLARGLLKRYDSLTGLATCSEAELKSVKGLGAVKAQMLKAALEIGRRLHEETVPRRLVVRTPEEVARLLQPKARAMETEVFWILHLDAKNGLKGQPREITRGLLDASLVHPREVFQEAIRAATAAVVVAHNHPSGNSTPSAEDVRITKQLIEAGRILDIKVLDHVIVGKPTGQGDRGFTSMREEGILDFQHRIPA